MSKQETIKELENKINKILLADYKGIRKIDKELYSYIQEKFNKLIETQIKIVSDIQFNIDLRKNDDTMKGKVESLNEELTKEKLKLDELQFFRGIATRKNTFYETMDNLINECEFELNTLNNKTE